MVNVLPYIWLVLLWLLFGIVHSLFATTKCKLVILPLLKSHAHFYRLLYSLINTVLLIVILAYHFSIQSKNLWQPPLLQIIMAAILFLVGGIIMVVTAKNYFLDLSGINAALKKDIFYPLQVTGLHRFVRHPLYTGTLIFLWSFFCWQPNTANLITCICIHVYTYTGTFFEEQKLIAVYGKEYLQYKAHVPRLFPFLGKN
ncbi:methyltransferase family protein [Limnovirga soli]|uniref:NnrU domain-containing protein n=1 Tax=Limnovirga soli TaxID=2656915 RepID=A0A8J8FDU5_9BACT|nr:isoprenylcysteine carboxylmethyltransferase family protein [Limnovirga soli]NNV56128.1 hypothetical protein [Limnovirga soli]